MGWGACSCFGFMVVIPDHYPSGGVELCWWKEVQRRNIEMFENWVGDCFFQSSNYMIYGDEGLFLMYSVI